MKILYITSRAIEINASSSIRNYSTILGMKEIGCDVTLVSMTPDCNDFGYDSSLSMDVKKIYLPRSNVKNLSLKTNRNRFLFSIKKMLAQVYSKFEIYDSYKSICKYSIEQDLKSFDVIISSSDPKSSHLLAYKLIQKSSFTGKWIQIWGDPFALDITNKSGITYFKKKEERKLLFAADKVIYVSPATLQEQSLLFQELSYKFEFIPIPFKEEIVYPKIEKEEINILYCGDYNSDIRNIIPLYDAINSLKDKKLHLTICGSSNLNICSSEYVEVQRRVSYEKMKKFEKNADILVHISNLSGGQIPGKIYQYSGTNKRILFVLDGDKNRLYDLFDKYNRYDFVDNNKMDIAYFFTDRMVECNCNLQPVEKFSPTKVAKQILGKFYKQ